MYENAFGTVALRVDGLAEPLQITTFRQDHDYADFRRPHRIVFGGTIEVDLARRDFTMNAIAWGGPAGVATDPAIVDPYDGVADIGAGLIRAVGDPAARFQEDALRILRAVRFAATLGFELEAVTLAAIREHGPLSAHLSGERVLGELDRLLLAPRPSVGLRLLSDTGVLATYSRTSTRNVASRRTRSRARTCGRTRSAPSTPPPLPRTCGWRPCSMTSASQRPLPTGGSSATTPSGRGWRRSSSTASTGPASGPST